MKSLNLIIFLLLLLPRGYAQDPKDNPVPIQLRVIQKDSVASGRLYQIEIANTSNLPVSILRSTNYKYALKDTISLAVYQAITTKNFYNLFFTKEDSYDDPQILPLREFVLLPQTIKVLWITIPKEAQRRSFLAVSYVPLEDYQFIKSDSTQDKPNWYEDKAYKVLSFEIR